MPEEPINRNDGIQQDVLESADNTENGLDETGDKIKAGARAMVNKVRAYPKIRKDYSSLSLLLNCDLYPERESVG